MELLKEGVDLFMFERFSVYRNVAAVLGSLVLLRFTLRFLSNACRWLRAYFLAPWGIGRTNLKKYGPWAIVTGASEGIGRGYALELARQGLNVVLISRSQTKLDKVADEIRERYSREVCVVPVDFSHGAEIYPQLAESVQDFEIGILVNNVGFGTEYPDLFLDIPIERMRQIIEINTQAAVHMTHLFMPKMVARKRGIVINISSASAIRPNIMFNVYASTKVFLEFFTTSLSLEYPVKGVIIQTLAPFFVATEMTKIRRTSWIIPGPNQFARAALATVGILDYTNGCLSHAIQGALYSLLPNFLMLSIVRSIRRYAKVGYSRRNNKEK